MSEQGQQILSFKLKTKEGAEVDFHADNLSVAQMNNILNNIIKPSIVTERHHLKSIMGSLRHIAPTIQRPKDINEIVQSAEMETLPVLEKTPDDTEERLKAEKLNDKILQNKNVSIVDIPKRATTSMLDIVGHNKLQELYNQAPPEQVKSTDGAPDYYHTGIKYSGDRPRYRTYYQCPRCGQAGRHYIPSSVTDVSCHNCQSKLQVDPATPKGFGHGEAFRDASGNFFIARVLKIDNTPLYTR